MKNVILIILRRTEAYNITHQTIVMIWFLKKYANAC